MTPVHMLPSSALEQSIEGDLSSFCNLDVLLVWKLKQFKVSCDAYMSLEH